MSLCMDVCTQYSCRRCQKIPDALELELQSTVSCPARDWEELGVSTLITLKPSAQHNLCSVCALSS